MRNGEVYFDPASRFPNGTQDLRFARVAFRVRGADGQCTAEFYSVSGFFFSIQFDRPTRAIRRSRDPSVISASLTADPSAPVSDHLRTSGLHAPEPASLSGWLLDWQRRFAISSLATPTPADVRARWMRSQGVALPRDYLELLDQTDGLEVDGCVVLGMREVYESGPIGGLRYWVIAQLREAGLLASSPQGAVFFADFAGSSVVPVAGFRAAVERYLLEGREGLLAHRTDGT